MTYLKKATISMLTLLFISGVFVNNAFAAAPLARIVVAKSGGNYTTITAALNAITPTATNRYVIEVWPGEYTEAGTVNMKSYVHLKGSGRDVTTVKTSLGSGTDVISVNGKTDVTISGLTVTGGRYGINLSSSATTATLATVSDNTLSNNSWYGVGTNNGSNNIPNTIFITGNKVIGNTFEGIDLTRTTATVIGNYISGNGSGTGLDNTGIFVYHDMGSVISGNVITGNNGCGIEEYNESSPKIIGNTITDNTSAGVCLRYIHSGGTVVNNIITNNGGTSFPDVIVADGNSGTPRTPTISNNVFDDITGTRAVGAYNSTVNGDPILIP